MIEIRGCSKAFGTLMAVSKVSLEIGKERSLVWLEATVQGRVHFFV